jgi:hypothetical protein
MKNTIHPNIEKIRTFPSYQNMTKIVKDNFTLQDLALLSDEDLLFKYRLHTDSPLNPNKMLTTGDKMTLSYLRLSILDNCTPVNTPKLVFNYNLYIKYEDESGNHSYHGIDDIMQVGTPIDEDGTDLEQCDNYLYIWSDEGRGYCYNKLRI